MSTEDNPLEGVAKTLLPIDIKDEMRTSYMDYSMSVIIGRALPDVRDGLKPVHRRILYAMYREGLLSNRKYSKCAGVVGEVLKSTTRTATALSMTPWSAWLSRGTCATCSLTARETLARWTGILLQPIATLSPG